MGSQVDRGSVFVRQQLAIGPRLHADIHAGLNKISQLKKLETQAVFFVLCLFQVSKSVNVLTSPYVVLLDRSIRSAISEIPSSVSFAKQEIIVRARATDCTITPLFSFPSIVYHVSFCF